VDSNRPLSGRIAGGVENGVLENYITGF
jgi:hypothetical protein